VLISPWCDLSHSFPSIHANTATVSPSLGGSLTKNVLSIVRRMLYLIMVYQCINLVSYGHLLRIRSLMVSVRGSGLVSGESPGSTTKAG